MFDAHSHPSHPPALSINTNFALDDWNRSSSPMSMSNGSMPTTPEGYTYADANPYFPSTASSGSGCSTPASSCIHTPSDQCSGHFGTAFAFDAFDHASGFTTAGYPAAAIDNTVACGMKPVDHLDLEFAAFMNSFPQY